MSQGKLLHNGNWVDAVPPNDRGFAYGDGLFETIRLVNGEPVLWKLHVDRLLQGCERLDLPLSQERASALSEDVQILWETQGRPADSVIKIQLTRAAAGRGYRPGSGSPNVYVSLHDLPPNLSMSQEGGLRVKMLNFRLARQSALAGIKHLNRLEQVLASQELTDEDEGILCDTEGWVVEGTRSNLLVLTAGRWMTPDLGYCGVAGVMRQYVLETAPLHGIDIEVLPIRPQQVFEAEGLLLMNSVMGLCPVRALDSVGRNIPDSLRTLQNHIHKKLHL